MMLDTKYEGAVLRVSKHCQKDFCVMHTLVYVIHNTLGQGHFLAPEVYFEHTC